MLPDFFNWNRVKVRYCDGASFSGEGYNEVGSTYLSCLIREKISTGHCV